jgi:hypothetical protein
MKRLVVAVGVLSIFATGAAVGHAAAVAGTPEVDKANATLSFSAQPPLRQVSCAGEDGSPYVTFSGTYIGSETDVTVGSTDYSLSGTAVIKGISWTINTATKRGYLTGAITLSTSTDATFAGNVTLVSDGLPAAGAAVPARGTIQASFKPADDGVTPPNDDILFANIEFKLGLTGAGAMYGDAAGFGGTPNFSVVTNLPADGHC